MIFFLENSPPLNKMFSRVLNRYPEVFYKNPVLKNFAKIHINTLAIELFLQLSYRLQSFYRTLMNGCFQKE